MKDGSVFSTRMAAAMAALCGCERYGANGFTQDEMDALVVLYGFDMQACTNELERAGATRNLFRAAEQDGLRCMAFLARYCEEGQDPVQLVAAGLAELGFDVQLEEEECDHFAEALEETGELDSDQAMFLAQDLAAACDRC